MFLLVCPASVGDDDALVLGVEAAQAPAGDDRYPGVGPAGQDVPAEGLGGAEVEAVADDHRAGPVEAGAGPVS